MVAGSYLSLLLLWDLSPVLELVGFGESDDSKSTAFELARFGLSVASGASSGLSRAGLFLVGLARGRFFALARSSLLLVPGRRGLLAAGVASKRGSSGLPL